MKNNTLKTIKNMLFISVVTGLGTFTANAQEATQSKEPETLFSKGISLEKVGFMASVGADYTRVSNTDLGLYMFKGGIVFNDKLTIGGYYGESLWDFRPSSLRAVYGPRVNMDASLFGGFLEYTMYSNRLFHLTMPLKVGAINLEIDEYDNPNDWDYFERFLFTVEPQIHLEMNIHKYARFFVGAGYRFVGGEFYNNGGFIPAPGNALSAQVGIKMGMFKLK